MELRALLQSQGTNQTTTAAMDATATTPPSGVASHLHSLCSRA